MYDGNNPILKYFSWVRPQIWDAPDYEKAAFLIAHGMSKGSVAWSDMTDALAELIPEQREFWLRAQATWDTQFVDAMTAMFEDDLGDDSRQENEVSDGLREL